MENTTTIKRKWYKTKWFIGSCIGIVFAGGIGGTIAICYNAWFTRPGPSKDLKVEFESATNSQTGQPIPNSDNNKPITMTKNPLSDDWSTDTTQIQLHGLITNRSSDDNPIYQLDDDGQTLIGAGYIGTRSNTYDLDRPTFNISLLKDISNKDATIPHYFDVTLKLDNKSISKHIILTGWTEWQNMPTGGITNNSGTTTMSTAGDTLVIGTHLLNAVDNIAWSIKSQAGADATGMFDKTDNLNGTFSFALHTTYINPNPLVIEFIGQNNGLNSNTIAVTLQQA